MASLHGITPSPKKGTVSPMCPIRSVTYVFRYLLVNITTFLHCVHGRNEQRFSVYGTVQMEIVIFAPGSPVLRTAHPIRTGVGYGLGVS